MLSRDDATLVTDFQPTSPRGIPGPPFKWIALWGLLALVYLAVGKAPISRAYLDFGDGNYQYISWRLTQGVQLYTDILSPQPPFHLWMGAALVRIAETFGMEPLSLFRWSIHALRVLTSLSVFGVGWLLFRSGGVAWLASLVFLILPEGYRWSQGYQSEHLELLFLTAGWAGVLSRTLPGRVLAGVFAVFALWTNMSSLPFAFLLMGHAAWLPSFSWKALSAATLTLALLLTLCLGLAGPAYIENVWSNQVASIPDSPSAWIASLVSEGTTIIMLEGLFILLALLGMVRFVHLENADYGLSERVLTTLYGVASVGAAVYVIKGGTVDYIYMLAEPAIAVFAASALAGFLVLLNQRTPEEGRAPVVPRVGLALCQITLVLGLITLLAWQPVQFSGGVRYQSGAGVDLPDQSQGRIVEYSDVEVRTLEQVIEHFAKPGDIIWAPPFLAALTRRALAMDLSETYLWWVRWNHSLDKGKDEGVDRMIEGMTRLIEDEKLSVLLINDRTGQWGQLLVPNRILVIPSTNGPQEVPLRKLDPRLDRLQSALETHYHPVLVHPGSDEKLYFQGWNKRIEVWVPKKQPQVMPPWVQVGFGAPGSI